MEQRVRIYVLKTNRGLLRQTDRPDQTDRQADRQAIWQAGRQCRQAGGQCWQAGRPAGRLWLRILISTHTAAIVQLICPLPWCAAIVQLIPLPIAMVRLILSPKSIEAAFQHRVNYGRELQMMEKFFRKRRTADTYIVLLCQDCRIGSSEASVKKGLQTMMDHLAAEFPRTCAPCTVKIVNFSFFKEDPELMAKNLRMADLFYMCGMHQPYPHQFHLAMQDSPLVPLLREQVMYNRCSYWGVCGGAKIAGTTYTEPGSDTQRRAFEFLEDVCIAYHDDVVNRPGVLQIAQGIALAYIQDEDESAVHAFPCVKNAEKWRARARRISELAAFVLQEQGDAWYEYPYPGEVGRSWFFNPKGFCRIDGVVYKFRYPV